MNIDNYIYFGVTLALIFGAAYIARKIYQKVKSVGVEDDMGFRLIGLIVSFSLLYASNIVFSNISRYSRPEYIEIIFYIALGVVALYASFVFLLTVKVKLVELGFTKILKKVFYSAVVSSVGAWGATSFGLVDGVTLANVVIGGVIAMNIQLLG